MSHFNDRLRLIWRWISTQIIQDVPKDSALCVYDCRKGHCTLEEWMVCERRLTNASGELMPADQNAGKIMTKGIASDT